MSLACLKHHDIVCCQLSGVLVLEDGINKEFMRNIKPGDIDHHKKFTIQLER